jgi:phosphoglucosamine mutase
VAVTVMTNYGFHQAMAEAGIEVEITPVGDRYVLEALLANDWALGGEQSGHVIDRGFVPSGDGTASALLTLEALRAAGKGLHDVIPMEKLPQRLVNVRVADRDAIDGAGSVWSAVDAANADLEGRGRVLVRASGTEPLVRVMVEAPTADEADGVCDRLVGLIRAELAPSD